ncbi:MAG: DUF4131 domain-containing protein [Lutibacter sp.]|uniref:ComEC/Rec2 family competence protein n=1 Tax=Lutibacter sp. TaxID=1925666 RepID=UPI001A0D6D9B|nr:ComEC/Rec2 family competence protein [Lutibacter sp.]NOR27197.1 DUF4131 domain-containing protein [Lutibacter sp.]
MKQFLKFVPAQLTFLLVLGILFGNYYNFQPNQLVIILSVLLISFTFLYFKSNKKFQPSLIFTLLFFLISFFIGVSSITYKNQLNNQLHYANSSEFAVNKTFQVGIKIEKILKPTLYFNKYEAKVIQVKSEKTIGRILVNIKKDSIKSALQINDFLVLKTQFLDINKPLNPYTFNYKNYLKNQQIHYQLQLKKHQFLRLENKNESLSGIASNIRTKINTALQKNGFKNDELAVINALLLGQRNTISSDLLKSYSGAGAIHILAVSGLHVGIILLLLLFVFKPFHYFKNGKLIATLLIIILLWVYAIIAGLSASVVRAVSMFTALTIGLQLVQRSNVYNTLVISMFFLLLFNPFYLFEVGFQLSYLAVFSIVWIQPKLYKLWNPKFWVLNKFWQLFTVSMAAQIGVLPLSLFYFHQFPGLFFLSNLVIIPFLGFILTAGIIVILLAYLNILPQFIANSYSFIIQQMNSFVDWISNQELFIIQNISFSFVLMLALYAFIVVTIKWIENKKFYRFVFVFVSIIVIQSIFIFEKHKLHSTNEFIVFHKSKKSSIGFRNGNSLISYNSDSLMLNDYVVNSYLIGSKTEVDFKKNSIRNLYNYKNETILVVDSLGLYKFNTIKPSIVVLQQSPKINLDRLIYKLQPKLIIVDGSNYKSYVERWRKTCLKNKTPFHSTMQKGAYVLN